MPDADFRALASRHSGYTRDAAGVPQLHDSLVLFLDVLGMSNLARRQDASRSLERLDAALRELRTIVERGWGYDFAWFSDSLVVGFPIQTWHGEDELVDVLHVCQQVQYAFSVHGFAARGGLARGDLFMETDLTFGAGLVRAVELEQAANNPRVLVDRDVVDLASEHLNFYGGQPSAAPQSRYFCVEGPDVFVNYLHATEWYYSGDDIMELRPLLVQHGQHVRAGLAETASTPRQHEKWVWLAGYHNWFCRDIRLIAPDVAVPTSGGPPSIRRFP